MFGDVSGYVHRATLATSRYITLRNRCGCKSVCLCVRQLRTLKYTQIHTYVHTHAYSRLSLDLGQNLLTLSI